MSGERHKRIRIHDGTHTADDWRRLEEAIESALEAEAEARQADSAYEFDRERIRQAFTSTGFEVDHFDLPWDDELAKFLPALEWIHTEDIPMLIELYELYPTGWVEGPFVTFDEFIDEVDRRDQD